MAAAIPAPVLAAASQPAAPAAADAAPQAASESLTLARSIVTTAFPPDSREEMMEKLMTTVVSQMKDSMPLDTLTDPGLRKIVTDYLEGVPGMLRPATSAFIPKQMEAIAQAYTQIFTLAELRDVAAFAHTPSGKTFLQRSTEVLSQPAVAAVNRTYFREAGEISRKGEAQLKAQVIAYIKEHPEAIAQNTQKQPAEPTK
ncbi:DUF2059 domain-containing protein [Novosphingobium beihaiensis]|uniref:DUF2059 domain-containing protein n=1 Tax=Novosphingobium beihaiensis TaxID=2930389 RepID=A0ABT0BQS8_9SPHN|nr:DUF2059 domain-containing protein [Novosphingobium beihaiensis]MCJ2187402.1 DUF2059 domain-containing protein [Novosphingobium beihaiensis]